MLKEEEQAKELLAAIQNKKAAEQDAITLIEKGLQLEQISKDLKAQFHEAKLLFLWRNAQHQKGIDCCGAYAQFLNDEKVNEIHLLSNARFRMLFLFGLGKKLEAVQEGDQIILKSQHSTKEEVLKKLSDIYWITGGLATNIGDYDKCTSYFNKALVIANRFNQVNTRNSIYAALGDVYKNNKEHENAIKYLKLGIKESSIPAPTNITCSMLCNLGQIYSEQNQSDKAEACFLKSREFNAVLKHPRTEVLTLVYLATFYCQNENLKAFKQVESELIALEHFQKDDYFKTSMLSLQSEVKLLENKLERALELANNFEAIAEKQQGLLDLQKAYNLKLKIYKKSRNFQEAVSYYDKLNEVKEKLLNEANKKHLQEFEMKFQSVQKEKEIQSLKLESVSFQLQSLRAQMNPHFVFNTIASISQDLKAESVEKSKDLLGSFARLMRANLEFAEQDKISLQEEIKFLNDYLLLEKNRLGHKLEFSINYNEDLDLDFIELPSMILQPYIENAVKHGIMPLDTQGTISISFEEIEDELICTIEDNGVGRAQAKLNQKNKAKHLGKSSSLNEKRLQLLTPKVKESLKVTYLDRKNQRGESQGTLVRISIAL